MGMNGSAFVHPALFYSGIDDYLIGVGGFLRSGLAAGEPVFASVPPARLGPLREYLGADTGRVRLFDMSQVGRNPGRIMTALTDFADRRGSGRAWLVGEPIWASRSADEIREATRHEALINLAFADVPVTILCPYDTTELPAATLADAERTHPVLWTTSREWESPAYTDPLIMNARCDTLPAPPADAAHLRFDPSSLSSARQAARSLAQSAGLSPDRAVDLVLAVGEAAANAIRHGGGTGTLLSWCELGELIIEIRDTGRLTNPLAGRRRPGPTATHGRGLWLIHQLCDLVELAPGALRLHMALTPARVPDSEHASS